jgi:hypothetical protein
MYCPMSYVIQNFRSPSLTLRMSLKLKSLLVLRNAHALYTLFWLFSKPSQLGTINYHSAAILQKLSLMSSKRLPVIVFPRTAMLKRTPIGVNFNSSAFWTALSTILSMFSKREPLLYVHSPIVSTITYPFPKSTSTVVMVPTSKALLTALHKFLLTSLSLWWVWPKNLKPGQLFINLHSYWFLLKFLNKYFYKVYNI